MSRGIADRGHGLVRSMTPPAHLLLASELAFNIGFYMLIPYLAGHVQELGFSAWTVGLVLGLRNFSQQGLAFAGGAIAEAWDYKRTILLGCLIRSVGFLLFAISGSVAAVLAASFLSGFASALFAPAMKAYASLEAAGDSTRFFAAASMLSQVGAVVGPLVGVALYAQGFRTLSSAAALVFLVWGLVLAFALPARRISKPESGHIEAAPLRSALSNRRFVSFACWMAGYAVLFNQLYLSLPLAFRRAAGSDEGVGVLFTISGLMVIVGQIPVTMLCKARWTANRCIVLGLVLMGCSFLPLTLIDQSLLPVFLATALLTLGLMIAFPFAMETVTKLSEGKHVAAYFGVYYVAAGVAAAVGNTVIGYLHDVTEQSAVVWLALAAVGIGAAAGLNRMEPVPMTPI